MQGYVEAEEPCSDGENWDDAIHGDEYAPEHGVPTRELTADTLIGLGESGGVEPAAQPNVFNTKLEIVNEEAQKLMQLELQRRRQAMES
ncbi:hypothetical protein N9L19_00845 [bacterium]|nr:hypothetical protein [bacterium]